MSKYELVFSEIRVNVIQDGKPYVITNSTNTIKIKFKLIKIVTSDKQNIL